MRRTHNVNHCAVGSRACLRCSTCVPAHEQFDFVLRGVHFKACVIWDAETGPSTNHDRRRLRGSSAKPRPPCQTLLNIHSTLHRPRI
jgi:hypothetical protein